MRSKLKPRVPRRLAYTVDEAACLIGVSRAFLYVLWKDSRGPRRTRINGKVLVTHRALDTWLSEIDGTTVISAYWADKIAVRS